MNVASHELSKRLYELSNWDDTRDWYGVLDDAKELGSGALDCNQFADGVEWDCPAYDLSYLLHKLPDHISGNLILEADGTPEDRWCAYYDARPVELKAYYNNKPEDAVAKLAIELFKQGILERES